MFCFIAAILVDYEILLKKIGLGKHVEIKLSRLDKADVAKENCT